MEYRVRRPKPIYSVSRSRPPGIVAPRAECGWRKGDTSYVGRRNGDRRDPVEPTSYARRAGFRDPNGGRAESREDLADPFSEVSQHPDGSITALDAG